MSIFYGPFAFIVFLIFSLATMWFLLKIGIKLIFLLLGFIVSLVLFLVFPAILLIFIFVFLALFILLKLIFWGKNMKNKIYLKELFIDVAIFTGIFMTFIIIALFIYKFIV